MSGVLVPWDTGGIWFAMESRIVNSLHFFANAGRTPFSLVDAASSLRSRRLRQQNAISRPMMIRPAMDPARPPMMAYLRDAPDEDVPSASG